MTTLGRPNLNLILISKQRYCTEKSVSTFLHFLLLASEKDCFTFIACLWYLMDSKTSKYFLPVYAFTRLLVFPLLYTSLTRNSASSLTSHCLRKGLWDCRMAPNKECLCLRRQTVTLQKFLSLLCRMMYALP